MVNRIHFPVLVEPEGPGFLLAVGERLLLEATYSPMPCGLPQPWTLTSSSQNGQSLERVCYQDQVFCKVM